MHIKIRTSALKHKRKTSFLRRSKTRSGRAIISRQRARAAGKKKRKN